jgi:hypothetical protein
MAGRPAPASEGNRIMLAAFATLSRFQRSSVIFCAVWISGSTMWLAHLV